MPPTSGTRTTMRKGMLGGARAAAVGIVLCAALARSQAPAPTAPVPQPSPQSLVQLNEQFSRAITLADPNRTGGRKSASYRAAVAELRSLLRDHPQNENAALATLAVLEADLCETDAGYPDCAAWAIRHYEAFLQAYPYTTKTAAVQKRLLVNYLDLAFSFTQDRPWHSPEKAELCLGRALQWAEQLGSRTGPEAEFGRDMAGRIRASGQAYSIVPGGLNNPLGD